MAEELDALSGTRLGSGIHLVATATMCAKGASTDELELAKRVLLRDPKKALPREIEGALEAFNRHMDTAIESCNRSSSEPTRAARRARLASDLERAGLVLIEQCTLAELLERQLAGKLDEEPSFGAEMLTDEEADELVARINGNPNLHPVTAALDPGSGGARRSLDGDYIGSIDELEFIGDVGRNPIDPSVND